jgi:hypothetical protein
MPFSKVKNNLKIAFNLPNNKRTNINVYSIYYNIERFGEVCHLPIEEKVVQIRINLSDITTKIKTWGKSNSVF